MNLGFWIIAATLASSPLEAPSTSLPLEHLIEHHECDLVIAEASLGGIAAALQASRLGIRTCLSSMTDWVGGQMTTQGISAIDGPWHFFKADQEFLEKFGHQDGAYGDHPHTDEVQRTMAPFLSKISPKAECWVSWNCFRPSDGDRALKELLQPLVESGVLKIFYEMVPKRVNLVDSKIESVDFISRTPTGNTTLPRPYSTWLSNEISDWYLETNSDRYLKKTIRLQGKIFIDATEAGELIALSGAQHRLGREGSETELPDPECVMGFTFPLNLAMRHPLEQEMNLLAKIQDPPGSLPFDISQGGKYKFWTDDPTPTLTELSVFDYRRISNDPAITLMNWADGGNDYNGKNFIIPVEKLGDQLTDWRGGIRIEALEEAERHALAFAYWLNQQDLVKFQGRGVTPLFDPSASDNFFGTGTGLSKFPYIRETRRIEGYQGFVIQPQEVTTDEDTLGEFPGPQYSNFYDSVGIGSYPIDTRACPGKAAAKYLKRFGNHYQIPLRALISSNVPNLMVAHKSLAATQIVNAAYRVHPTEWNTGFGSGTAAAVAIKNGWDPHQLMENRDRVKEVQSEIIRTGGRVLWFSDQLPPS